MINLIYILAFVLAWLFFYKILVGNSTRLPKLKTTIIVLLFSSLIYAFSYDLYSFFNRAAFSFKKQGEIELTNSPFKIPPNQDASYCTRFTDQNGTVINTISTRADGRYCGTFWRFNTKNSIFLPYRIINDKQRIYWASPELQITVTN
ncbi:MAG: hypothetical protein Q8M40_10020 [Legionella sp.]|nr:hypothetical protein [Legionella sp.]